jgi:ketosteroid isomerase-like protein
MGARRYPRRRAERAGTTATPCRSGGNGEARRQTVGSAATDDRGRPVTASDDRIDVPEVIGRYQAAHDRRDASAATATFAPDATVADDGSTYVGADEIRRWIETAASEFTYTRTLIGAEREDERTWIVHNNLAGDFPGGTVDLSYRFVLDGDLIERLDIAP